MPVLNCKAVLADKADALNMFYCPVYKTQQRGPTYVFTANTSSRGSWTARQATCGCAVVR